MITYIILKLILDATTGQPLEVGPIEPVVSYASLDDCERAKSVFGPQKPKDNRVAVYSCATERQVTAF